MTTHLPTLDTPDLRYFNVHVTAPAAITVALRRKSTSPTVDQIALGFANMTASSLKLENQELNQIAARHSIRRLLANAAGPQRFVLDEANRSTTDGAVRDGPLPEFTRSPNTLSPPELGGGSRYGIVYEIEVQHANASSRTP